MTKPHYESQIEKKLKMLVRERAELMKQIGVIDEQITILNQALKIMGIESEFSLNYRKRVFAGGVQKGIIQALKANPDKGLSVQELALTMLEKEGKGEVDATPKHLQSIRLALNSLRKKEVVEHLQKNKAVVWQLKGL